MNEIELFLGFLKDEGIYSQYIRHYVNRYRTNSLDKLKTFNPEVFISGPLSWEYTNEGMNFWADICEKWLGYLFTRQITKK